MTLIWAFVRNLRTGSVMLREKVQSGHPTRPKVPMHRSGAHCSVVAKKRGNARGAKGAGHPHQVESTGNRRNSCLDGRRQSSLGGTSRMNREIHVRICEGLGVKFPGPTRRDGAVWITEQMEAQFGTQAKYLVDFPHVCEYLSAAGEVIAGNNKPDWMEKQKDGLKDNRWKEVLEALRPFLEQANIPDPDAPVRACFRYISNHSNFLDYKGALAAGLPIGSGEIESAHRYVFQKRLKISGAWWKMENLKKVIALRDGRTAIGKITGTTCIRRLHKLTRTFNCTRSCQFLS